jgi:dTDP-4-amino-4,6-dideoxygalactose transaminase
MINSGRRASQSTDTIPLLRPLLPSLELLAPYLREIEQNRWYTNSGPLVARFESRLAEHFRVRETGLAVTANGTTALSVALLAAGATPGRKCLVPAWTFVASAAAIWAANLVPHFVDVAPDSWIPDPGKLRRRSDLSDVGAVMVVGPFGTPVETAPWDAFSAETGIPVVIDGAACFDSVASVRAAQPGRSPITISLHATKAVGVGEGGFVISTDDEVVHRVRQIANFGIGGSPRGQLLGYNGKMSEYHAAVGLAALDGWPARRAALVSRTDRYIAELARVPNVRTSPSFGRGWVSAYCTVHVPVDARTTVARLSAMGVESRRWWHDGVHAQPAYCGFPSDPLPATNELAAHVLSLPFSHDMTDAQITRVADCLERALAAPD